MTAAVFNQKTVFIFTTSNPYIWPILIGISTYLPFPFNIKSESISIHSVKIWEYFNKNCENYWPAKWCQFLGTQCYEIQRNSPWITIHTFCCQWLSIQAKELKAATHVMQSTSNEWSTPVSGSAKCKQAKGNTKCVIIPELTYVIKTGGLGKIASLM